MYPMNSNNDYNEHDYIEHACSCFSSVREQSLLVALCYEQIVTICSIVYEPTVTCCLIKPV